MIHNKYLPHEYGLIIDNIVELTLPNFTSYKFKVFLTL